MKKTNYNWVKLYIAVGHQILKIITSKITRVGIGENK